MSTPAHEKTKEPLGVSTLEEAPKAPARSPLERLGLRGRALSIGNWVAVVGGIYVLITAVNVIGAGFKGATGGQAEELFAFASNPLVALMIGVVATALIQSSSTTTSIVVGLVAGGLPMSIAIPMLMGANVGTTLTSTLVSLGMARDKEAFRRGFAAASVHDFFNLLAVIIFLPLELMFGILERVSGWLSNQMAGTDGGIAAAIFGGIGNAVKTATSPLSDFFGFATSFLPQPWHGIVMIGSGIALILLALNPIGKLTASLLRDGPRRCCMRRSAAGLFPASPRAPSSAGDGAVVIHDDGAGSGRWRDPEPSPSSRSIPSTPRGEHRYDDRLIAAFAFFEGIEAQFALQAALPVHMLFNIFANVLDLLRPAVP
ncbi:MAG: Na/Pi symporter [Tessaracoccus sp.]